MWGRFVTTFEEDMQQMVQEARERFNLKIIVSNYRGNPAQAITHPQGDAAQYARCRPTSGSLQGMLPTVTEAELWEMRAGPAYGRLEMAAIRHWHLERVCSIL